MEKTTRHSLQAKKIAIYSPYLPKHFGGGEKYILDVARMLARKHQVSIALPQTLEPELGQPQARAAEYEEFLGQPLGNLNWIWSPLGTNVSWWKKLRWTMDFDVIYYLTDGSFFWSWANKNIVHIQFPFTSKLSLSNRMKLLNWRVKNANSKFTAEVIKRHWGVQIPFIHYPVIEAPAKVPAQKQKIILNVGRFMKHTNAKKQDVLIEAFEKLIVAQPQLSKGWKLVLVGSVEDKAYADQLLKRAKGLAIEFHHDISREKLDEWYTKASIYWHATGYGVEPLKEPLAVEHFGISIVEAMGYGCIPLVVPAGGVAEVLGPLTASCGWKTVDQCVALTAGVLNPSESTQELRRQARHQAEQFNETLFKRTLEEMVN